MATATEQTLAPQDDSDVPRRLVTLTVNGRTHRLLIEDRQLLVDVLRNDLGLTGSHIGCHGGDCGACTVRLDGRIAKSCIVLAASVDGSKVTTIEGYAPDGELDVLQKALWQHDAFQCGFCLPGHLFALRDLLDTNPNPTEADVRHALIGNLCRCTGYVNFVAATLDAAKQIASGAPDRGSSSP